MKGEKERHKTSCEIVDFPLNMSFQCIHYKIHEIILICLNFICFFFSCRHIYLAVICANPFHSWLGIMLQRNAQVQNFWHFCGTLTSAFWHFSPKNSLMQSLYLSFFSVNNLGWESLSFSLAYRSAQQSVQPLWTTCSRPPLSLG